jgi:hypothetical protein
MGTATLPGKIFADRDQVKTVDPIVTNAQAAIVASYSDNFLIKFVESSRDRAYLGAGVP